MPIRHNFLFLIILYRDSVLYKKLSDLIVSIRSFIQKLFSRLFDLLFEFLSDLICLLLQLGGVFDLLE